MKIHFTENRPKKLLIFINPTSGRQKGVEMYEKSVAPYFNLAGINTDVVGELIDKTKW